MEFICKTYPLLLLTCLMWSMPSSGQNNMFDEISSSFQNYNNHVYHEKVFLHTDRTFYTVGEEIYFKAYLVDASTHHPSDLSAVIYVELIGKDTTVHAQAKVSMLNSSGAGSLFLSSKLNSGKYQLRAYTRWMRNFDSAYYFQKSISIFNPFRPMQFTKGSNSTYDIQFFPEGGHLVNSVESKLGVRAVNSNGKGVDYIGYLINNDTDTITTFLPLKFGLGSFYLTPVSGKSYEAHLYDSSDNLISKIQLPKAKEHGYVLSVQKETDRLGIAIKCDTSIASSQPVFLVIHCRGRVIEELALTLSQQSVSYALPIDQLGDGVNHITLFDADGNPICERLFFKHPGDMRHIQVSSAFWSYSPRDKVDLLINANQLTNAELSMSVYRLDEVQSLDKFNIVNYLLLNSDLTGQIESPWYYFGGDSLVDNALDNLMLTHGWRRFDWKAILTTDQWNMGFFPEYVAPIVEGKVIDNRTKAPAPYQFVYLSRPGINFAFRTAKSNKNGEIYFEMNNVYGGGNVYAKMAEKPDSLFEIKLYDGYSKNYCLPSQAPLNISLSQKPALESRSVTMQLDHIYRPNDWQTKAIDTTHFYGRPDESYYLDDYTRFPGMEEVMREYIRGVQARRHSSHYRFNVFNLNDGQLFSGEPLVLLDGLPIADMDIIMALDPLLINRIDVKRRKEFFGPMNFDGIVSIFSYDGQLAQRLLDGRMPVLDFDGLQKKRIYFAPTYDTQEKRDSRKPDFRELLYWNPSIHIKNAAPKELSFYTSDQTGTYHVLINGISNDGKLLHDEIVIEVVGESE